MRKSLRRKLAAVMCLVIGLTSIISGSLLNSVEAKADGPAASGNTVYTDTLTVKFFDYKQDRDYADKDGNRDKETLEIAKNNLRFGSASFLFTVGDAYYANKWFEFCRTTGIVGTKLGANGLPVFEKNFTSQNGVTPFAVNQNFVADAELTLEKSGNGLFGFDSKNQYMEFSTVSSSGNTVSENAIDKVATQAAQGQKITASLKSTSGGQFFPMSGSSTDEKCYFGVSFEKEFYLPKGGKNGSEDIQFTFSGDDDVWVFIDGELVLDIGGVHGAIEGNINFTTGEVSYAYKGDRRGQSGPAYNENPGEKYYVYSDESDADSAAETFLKGLNQGEYHKLSFFYLERGGSFSNCKFSYNLPTTTYSVQHVLEQADGSWKLANAVDTDYTKYFATVKSGVAADINAAEAIVYQIPNTELPAGVYSSAKVLEDENIIVNGSAIANDTIVKDDGSSVVYILYPRNSYPVNYKIEGDYPDEITVGLDGAYVPEGENFTGNFKVGTNVAVAPGAAEPASWVFEGWKINNAAAGSSFTMPAASVKVIGSYTRDAYNVSYEYTGDILPAGAPDLTEYKEEGILVDTTVIVKASPVVTGYEFSGWSNESVSTSDTSFTMPAADVILYGSWSPKTEYTYTVEYYLDNMETLVKTQPIDIVKTFDSNVSENDVQADFESKALLPAGQSWLDFGLDTEELMADYGAGVWVNASGTEPAKFLKIGLTENNVIRVLYTKEYTVTVNYLNLLNDGEQLKQSVVYTSKNADYDVNQYYLNEIDKENVAYYYVKSDKALEGSIEGNSVVINLYYAPKYTVTYEIDYSDIPEEERPVITVPEDGSQYFPYSVDSGSVSVLGLPVIDDGRFEFTTGWTDNESTPVTILDGAFAMPARNVKLVAKISYREMDYTVRYWFRNASEQTHYQLLDTYPDTTGKVRVGGALQIAIDATKGSYEFEKVEQGDISHTAIENGIFDTEISEDNNIINVYYVKPAEPPVVIPDPTPTPWPIIIPDPTVTPTPTTEPTTTPDPTPTAEPTETPEATPTPEEIEIPEAPETPQGGADEETDIPEGEEEILDIETGETPQGGTDEDVLPQTGTAPVSLFYVLGFAFIMAGAVLLTASGRKKKAE